MLSNVIVSVGLGINYVFSFNNIIKEYTLFFFLMYFGSSLHSFIAAYARGIERIADVSVAGVISSVTVIALNIFCLLVIKIGLDGYFIANIAGLLVSSIYLLVRSRMFADVRISKSYREVAKKMFSYSIPMIATTVAWWINSASDRYVVVAFLGVAENGIYSVASKIPSILSVFQSIFEQAWVISAVKEFDPKDSNGFFTKTYKAYNCMFVLLCSFIILADKLLARFLYAKDFYVAWRYVPWLSIAVLFSALAGYFGQCFVAVKQTKIISFSVMTGAVLNLVLNLAFTPLVGAMGAAVATTLSYFVVWIVRIVVSKKVITFHINLLRDVISYILLVGQGVVLLLLNGVLAYGVETGLLVIILLLYVKDIKTLYAVGSNAIKRKTMK